MSARKMPLVVLLGVMLGLHTGPGHARDDTPGALVLEAITITVQRRPEVLSKAPIAASVVSQAGLDSQGITALSDVASSVPNLQVAQNGFSMRGIGNNNPFGGYSTVAVQVDGICEPAYQALSLGLFDIDERWSVTYLAGTTRLVNDGVEFASGLFTLTNQDYVTRASSHEIDVNYEADALKLVGGIYAYRDRTSGAQKVGIGDALPYPLSSVLPPPMIISPGAGFEPTGLGIIDVAKRVNQDANDSNAVFGQATFSVKPDLRLTLGMRYTRDKFSTNGDSQVCAFGTVAQANMALSCAVPFGPPTSAVASSSSSNTSWRLAVDHDSLARPPRVRIGRHRL